MTFGEPELELVEMGDGVIGVDGPDGKLAVLLHWSEGGIYIDGEGMPTAGTPAGLYWVNSRRFPEEYVLAVETQDPTPEDWSRAAKMALDAFDDEKLILEEAFGRRPEGAPDPATDEELERWGAPLREMMMMIGGIEGVVTSPVTGREYPVSLKRWAGRDVHRTFIHLAFKNTDHGPTESD